MNQGFFKRLPCISPWKKKDNVFLLFGFVNIVKSIRNNRITEKTGELEFNYRGENYVAKWNQIRKFQKLEYGNLVKMLAANPKPIERQKLDTCLKVFFDETVDALKFHPVMEDEKLQN